MRGVVDQVLGPVLRPVGGRRTVEHPEVRRPIHGVHRLARSPGEGVERLRQVGDVERADGRIADQVAGGADLVGAVVEFAEAAGPRAGHGQPHAGQERHLRQGDLRALAGRVGPDMLADAGLAAAVGDQRHTEHQVLVDRAPAVADVTGDVTGDHRALGEADQYIAGQRALLRHRGQGGLGRPVALVAAGVVADLVVLGERIVELR